MLSLLNISTFEDTYRNPEARAQKPQIKRPQLPAAYVRLAVSVWWIVLAAGP